jgi:hypothetical protein
VLEATDNCGGIVTAQYPYMALKKVNVYFNEEEEVELYEAIVKLAKQEKRSINQQIKVLLTEAMETRQERSGSAQGEEGTT